jgi:hypothetical protein
MNSRRLRRLVGRGVAVAAVCLGLTVLGTGISSAGESTVPSYDPGYLPVVPVVVVPSAPTLPGGGVMTASEWTWN